MSAQYLSTVASPAITAAGCPFLDVGRHLCRAALLNYRPDARHLHSYCCSDDHDDCALFLAKALRSSSAGGQARDVTDLGEK